MSLSAGERARYQRHLSLPQIGVAGQEKLKAARVLVVGAGGLGSPAALYLAAAGCGTLGLVDGDAVELSNLQRQVLYDVHSIGQPKAVVAAQRLAALNPDIRVVAHALELTPDNVREIFAQYDVVLDGTDRLSTRYLINDACVILKLPLISAAIHQFEGHLFTYVPGQGPCYRCLFPHSSDGLVGNCALAGVLGVLPGVLGTLQATEAIKLIAGVGTLLSGRLLSYDALEMRFEEYRVTQRPDCNVCGDAPTITSPGAAAAPATPAGVRRLSAGALHELLQHTEAAAPLLIDVREPAEFRTGHLAGSIHIPLGQLPQHLAQIAPDAAPVFICRSGARSYSACQLALQARIGSPANLEGGLLAWAAEIDPTLEVL